MPTDSTKEQNKLRATLLRQIDQMPTLEAKKKDHLCQAITQTDHFALLLTISFETATTKITQKGAQKSRVLPGAVLASFRSSPWPGTMRSCTTFEAERRPNSNFQLLPRHAEHYVGCLDDTSGMRWKEMDTEQDLQLGCVHAETDEFLCDVSFPGMASA